MKKLLGAMLLCCALVGCGNSVDSIIEDAKDNLQTDVQIEYEKDFEENFIDLLERINKDEFYEITGYSLENKVVTISRNSTASYNDLVERGYAEFDSMLMQQKMFLARVNDVTIYLEYYNEDGEGFALLTVTNDNYKFEEIK